MIGSILKLGAALALMAALSGCSGGCLSPWTKLSDCPRGTPGYHGGSP